MKEIWKPVNGYEEQYEVSILGNIRNKVTGLILRQRTGRDGYIRCGLSRVSAKHQEGSCGDTTI